MAKKNPHERQSLVKLLALFHNDMAKALEAKGLSIECNAAGEIVTIADAMLCGNFTDEEFALLARCKQLTLLWFRGSLVTDAGLAALVNMPQLEDLLIECGERKLTDHGLVYLRHLPRLKQLHLEDSRVTGAGLSAIAGLPSLEDLCLNGSPVARGGMQIIAKFPRLSRLDLSSTNITDDDVACLAECAALEALCLRQCDELTDQTVAHLSKLPRLKSLELYGTKVTAACIDLLEHMPALEEVEFGDDVLTIDDLKRLEAAGKDVSHGKLKGFYRTINFLRYLGVDFEVDCDESSIAAYIDPAADDVTYVINVECTDEFVPDHMHGASLEGPAFGATGDWRQLDGQTHRIDFDEDEAHPILPDNPSNIYVGWHACPNHHTIEFVKRDGNRFLVEWHCEAKESLHDPGEPVHVRAWIPFTAATVTAEFPLTLEAASEILARHFSLADFELPEADDDDPQRFVFNLHEGDEA